MDRSKNQHLKINGHLLIKIVDIKWIMKDIQGDCTSFGLHPHQVFNTLPCRVWAAGAQRVFHFTFICTLGSSDDGTWFLGTRENKKLTALLSHVLSLLLLTFLVTHRKSLYMIIHAARKTDWPSNALCLFIHIVTSVMCQAHILAHDAVLEKKKFTLLRLQWWLTTLWATSDSVHKPFGLSYWNIHELFWANFNYYYHRKTSR